MTVQKWRNCFTLLFVRSYRDINICIAVPLENGRLHLCEIQFHLESIVEAKADAHTHYEEIRSRLPEICKGSGAPWEKVFAYVCNLLENSAADAAVSTLADKAGGLFIYANLLEKQLVEESRKSDGGLKVADYARLAALPAGLDDLYGENFRRTYPGGAEDPGWENTVRLIAMIAAAREPLPVNLARGVLGWRGEW